jgi:hypothetical protein
LKSWINSPSPITRHRAHSILRLSFFTSVLPSSLFLTPVSTELICHHINPTTNLSRNYPSQ